jgi:acetyl esterase/lipase
MDLPLWGPISPAPQPSCPVTAIREIPYDKLGEDPHRHCLDLFLPKDRVDCPVVILVHGGAWMSGDNCCCGLVSSVGDFLASQGLVAVLPNYRLSPDAKHPDHIQDLAQVFAWVNQHIEEYGGRPDQIFLVGHSAGGHLVSLLTTDEKYLNAVHHQTADIKGVVALSGVYRIPPGDFSVALGGASPTSFTLDEMLPVRGDGGWSWSRCLGMSGIPLSLNVFGPAFGDDPKTRADASPINHVRPGLPPFLLVSAENDLPTLPIMAEEFHAALLEQGDECQLLKIKDRNHNSICFRAIQREDPVAHAILDFIREHLPATSPEKTPAAP